jgi:hypothetical protein
MNITQAVWKDFAGTLYDDLVRSKESCLKHLSNPDSNVRIAAIHVCDSHWNCSADATFLDACRKLATTDPHDAVRAHAIASLGKAMRSSQDFSTSRFLADLVKNPDSSEDVRKEAYWALREVQLGLTEEDAVKRTIALLRLAYHELPIHGTEEDMRKVILGSGRYPQIDWDSVDQIDWDFVNRFASPAADNDNPAPG